MEMEEIKEYTEEKLKELLEEKRLEEENLKDKCEFLQNHLDALLKNVHWASDDHVACDVSSAYYKKLQDKVYKKRNYLDARQEHIRIQKARNVKMEKLLNHKLKAVMETIDLARYYRKVLLKSTKELVDNTQKIVEHHDNVMMINTKIKMVVEQGSSGLLPEIESELPEGRFGLIQYLDKLLPAIKETKELVKKQKQKIWRDCLNMDLNLYIPGKSQELDIATKVNVGIVPRMFLFGKNVQVDS